MRKILKLGILCIFMAGGMFFASKGSAQTWTEKSPSTHPSAMGVFGLAYDSENDSIVLYGGWDGGNFGETWAYDLNSDTWIQKSSSTPRRIHGMVYDSESDRIVVYGGYGTSYLSDTWEYDLNNDIWVEKFPSTDPSVRGSFGMAYDSESDRVVLFGGFNGSTYFDDTWTYDLNSNTWDQKFPSNHPTERYYPGMVYDSESDRIVLFGGYDGGYLDDTWEYDLNSNTWVVKSPSTHPSVRRYFGIAYDSESDRIVLFGGDDGSNLNDTWEYDLNSDTWAQKFPSTHPSERRYQVMAYDSASDRIVLFGGGANGSFFSDTWEYDAAPVGVEEEGYQSPIIAEHQLQVYPNPFIFSTTISLPSIEHPDGIVNAFHGTSSAEGIELTIYDVGGRLVKSFPLTTNQLSLGTDICSGVYFLKVDGFKPVKVVKLR